VSFAARCGRVHAAVGESVIAKLPGARVGEAVTIRVGTALRIPATVMRVDPERVELRAHTSVAGVSVGDEVVTDPLATTLPLGMRLLGRVIDSGGSALDTLGRVCGRRAAVSDRSAHRRRFAASGRAPLLDRHQSDRRFDHHRPRRPDRNFRRSGNRQIVAD
jgi:flagellar biosynthesis/type III secretory pathway ATPase